LKKNILIIKQRTIMKKLFIFFALLLIFNSCTSESDEDFINALNGVWENTSIIDVDNNLSQSFQYNFNLDNTIIITTTVLNDNEEILGFRFRASGEYTIDNEQLNLNLTTILFNDESNGLFSDLDDLELLNENQQQVFGFSINGNTLTFTFPNCGPNELCAESQSFQKISN